jgi:hypothetical protein
MNSRITVGLPTGFLASCAESVTTEIDVRSRSGCDPRRTRTHGLGKVVVLVFVFVAGCRSGDKPKEPLAQKVAPAPARAVDARPGVSGLPDVPLDTGDPGTPSPAGIADFWLWTRADGSVRVTSPVIETRFPTAPKVERLLSPNKTADGKSFYQYAFTANGGDEYYLRIDVVALGRNLQDRGNNHQLEELVGKMGPVTKTSHEDNGVIYTAYEAVGADATTLRLQTARDLARGLVITTTAGYPPRSKAIAAAFLGSTKLRFGPDVTDDAVALASEAAGKGFAVHTPDDTFRISVPWEPEITREPPVPDNHLVRIAAVAQKGEAKVLVQLAQSASWDGLTFTPENQKQLGEAARTMLADQTGLKATYTAETFRGMEGYVVATVGKKGAPSVQVRSMWDAPKNRLYTITCINTPCGPILDSMALAEAPPVP